MLTEEILLTRGFTRVDVSEEESGDQAFYYFEKEWGSISLITNDNLEAREEGWIVEFFEEPNMKFDHIHELATICNIFDDCYKTEE